MKLTKEQREAWERQCEADELREKIKLLSRKENPTEAEKEWLSQFEERHPHPSQKPSCFI